MNRFAVAAHSPAFSNAVYIYTADVTPLQSPDLFQSVYWCVSEERRKKTDRLRFAKDKYLSLGVECLLLRACRDFGVDYKRQRIVTDAFSKPKFADSPLHFNLSHSGERVLCVMSSFPVGCDVEKRHAVDLNIAKRFFFEDEYCAIEACRTQEEREALFFKLWTLKESFMKCTGLGFRLPLNAFSVSAEADEIRVKQSVDDARYILSERSVDDGYQYAWCIKDDADSRRIYDVQWKQMELDRDLEQIQR